MLGRGGVIRPDLAWQIKQYENGEHIKDTDFAEVSKWIRQFFEPCLTKEANNNYPLARLKQWLGMMRKECAAAQTVYGGFRTVKDTAEVLSILTAFERAMNT